MDLQGQHAFIVGGSSGLGRATAALALAKGARVTIASRSEEKLAKAVEELGNGAASCKLDMMDEGDVSACFASMAPGSLDHLVISASSAVHGPFAELTISKVEDMFASKFFGPYRVAKAALPALAEGGSITFFSGVLSRRPGMNCSGLGAVNAAVEGLARGLALELGPKLRVNCLSPGMVDTEAYAGLPEDKRQAMYRSTGESLPLGRVGRAEELAEAALFLMTNGFTTGQVLDVDGGHMVRQYATR